MGFLGAGLIATAGVLGGYAAHAEAASAVQVWGLDPDWDDGEPSSCGCGACNSCRSHAANKWFASAAAADAGRAHPFCKCGVVPLVQVSASVYDSLFADGTGRSSVDLRYQWVQAVLAHSPGAVLSDGPDGVQAGVRPAPILQGANGRRVLYVDVHTSQLVTAAIAVTRDGRMLARKTVKGVRGTWRIRLEIPTHTHAGPARLHLKLSTSSGQSKVVMRAVQIPRALPAARPR